MQGIIDIETYSCADIKDGGHAYATHPTTEVLCVGLDQIIWSPGDPIPAVPDRLFAWNAEFDRLIYDHILVPRHGWPRRYDWDCLMVRAYAANLPGKLESAAKVLGTTDKDVRGHTLMMQLCKPAPPTKNSNDPKRKHTPENLARLKTYCEIDVAAETAIAEMLPPLLPMLREVQKVDRRMNGHGIYVDQHLVKAMLSVHQKWMKSTLATFKDLTGLESSKGNAFPEWLEAQGVRHADGSGLLRKNGFDKAAVLDLLAQDPPPKARESLLLHREMTKTSLAKLTKILASVGRDGRLRGMYQFLGAHQTGRYAARRVQVQNLPGGVLKPTEIDPAIALVHDQDALTLSHLAGERGGITEVLASLLRPCFTATPGNLLVDADYSNVEGRIVAWLAGEAWKLRAFAEYDRGVGPDLYLLAYSKAFGVPIDKDDKDGRTMGKVMELACIAEDQLVLTDHGLVKIQEVTTGMKVWDGHNLVSHEGVVYQGEKRVITYDGLTATPDHLVYTNVFAAPMPLEEAVATGRTLRRTRLGAQEGPQPPPLIKQRRVRVYDILNAGPLHRFTVSDVLVHNCGYQGGSGALEVAASACHLSLPEEQKKQLRDAWCAAHPNVVGLWHSLEAAAIACVRRRTLFKVGRVAFRPSIPWPNAIEMVLPSGRCLTFHDAHVVKGKYGPQFAFYGEGSEDNGPRKWQLQTSYGGRFLENAAQAISFDLVADAMVRIEREGFPVVMTTHDEIAMDVPASRADLALRRLKAIMKSPPEWADGLPLSAGGWIGYRFRKD